jgi:hypothetical protein
VYPAKEMMETDFKEIQACQKKVESKRLQYDHKRNKNIAAEQKGRPLPVPGPELQEQMDMLNEVSVFLVTLSLWWCEAPRTNVPHRRFG